MIDFHSHLDLYPDPHSVAQECSVRGIYILSVTNTPSAFQGTSLLAVPGSRIRTALGLHPQIAHQRKTELGLFDSYLPNARYIGEIGLDGAPEFKKHWGDQMLVFRHILNACSVAGGRIMSIHSRRAASAVLDCLESYPDAGTAILHWFSGSKKELERATALGCWFSIGPSMLNGERARALVDNMPQERILTETDGPFARIDNRVAMPWDAERATALLAEIWKKEVNDAQQILDSNLRRLVTPK